jgi:hypothetical protein
MAPAAGAVVNWLPLGFFGKRATQYVERPHRMPQKSRFSDSFSVSVSSIGCGFQKICRICCRILYVDRWPSTRWQALQGKVRNGSTAVLQHCGHHAAPPRTAAVGQRRGSAGRLNYPFDPPANWCSIALELPAGRAEVLVFNGSVGACGRLDKSHL